MKTALVLLSVLGLCTAAITNFYNNKLNGNEYYQEKEGIYASNAPLTNYFGPPYISFSLTLDVLTQPTLNYLHTEVLIFSNNQRSSVGYKSRGETYYCCYQSMVDKGLCENAGSAIYDPAKVTYSWIANWYNLTGNLTISNSTDPTDDFTTLVNSTSISAYIQINSSALYSFWVISCGENDASVDGTVLINGPVVMSNIYGYLPGELAPLEVLWWLLFVLYLFWFVLWCILVTRFQQSIHPIQHIITGVLFLAVLENLLSASSYAAYNFSGQDNLGLNTFIFLISTFKSTSSLVGLLLVTMGWSITVPVLAYREKVVVWTAGVIYFVVDFIYLCLDMLANTSQTQGLNISSGAVTFFLVLVIIMEFVFLVLIYTYLTKTLIVLKATQRGGKKWTMFKVLGIILLFFYIVSIVLFAIQLGASISGAEDDWWKGWFFFTGYWSLVHLLVAVPLSFLWRPSYDNKKYAYEPVDNSIPTHVVALETAPEQAYNTHPEAARE